MSHIPVEESREQCTVVFALIVTEPDSENVCVEEVEGGGGFLHSPLPPNNRFRDNLCKDDNAFFFRFLPELSFRNN